MGWLEGGIILTVLVTLASVCGGALTLVMVVAFFGGMGYLVFKAVGRTRTATAAIQAWQPTEGAIAETMIVSDTSGDWERFEPRVTYTYTVNGVGYTGNVIRAGGPQFNVGAASREAAEIRMTKYQVGARVTVYYDPANPAVAVLEK